MVWTHLIWLCICSDSENLDYHTRMKSRSGKYLTSKSSLEMWQLFLKTASCKILLCVCISGWKYKIIKTVLIILTLLFKKKRNTKNDFSNLVPCVSLKFLFWKNFLTFLDFPYAWKSPGTSSLQSIQNCLIKF